MCYFQPVHVFFFLMKVHEKYGETEPRRSSTSLEDIVTAAISKLVREGSSSPIVSELTSRSAPTFAKRLRVDGESSVKSPSGAGEETQPKKLGGDK